LRDSQNPYAIPKQFSDLEKGALKKSTFWSFFAKNALFWHFYFTPPYSASQKTPFFTFLGLFSHFSKSPMQSLSDSRNPENPEKHGFSTFFSSFLSFFKSPMPPLSNIQNLEKDLKKEVKNH